MGAAPVVLAQTRRLQSAKRLIDETHLPMTEIALASGFRSLRRFNDLPLTRWPDGAGASCKAAAELRALVAR
jgi:AraC family transcriptional regulator of adaptative response / DNA-3-methyladenine glycosylase II